MHIYVHGEEIQGRGHLSLVAHTEYTARLAPRQIDGRNRDGHQHRDDRNDHEHLDHRECSYPTDPDRDGEASLADFTTLRNLGNPLG